MHQPEKVFNRKKQCTGVSHAFLPNGILMRATLFEIESHTMGRCVNKIALLALATLLTACGQTGPLYLPEPAVNEEPAAAVTSSESRQAATSAVSSATATTQE